jgi:ribosomal protein S18 acetylase RimI-like enzyme
MEIREIKTKEVDSFSDFFNKSVSKQFTEYSKKARNFLIKEEWTKKRIEDAVRGNYVIFLLAFEKEKIVGYLIGGHHFGGIATVMWIAIDSDYQGKGIGRKIMNKYISLLKKEGAHKINLTVTIKDNIGFYEKLGFKVQCFNKKDYFGLDSYIMYKDIQKPKW